MDDSANSIAKAILGAGEALVTHRSRTCGDLGSPSPQKLGQRAAEQFWERLRAGVATIELATLADLENAWQIGQSWRDQDFSIVDRTSFAVMQRLGILRVASLDSQFAVYRFGPNRRNSFTVLR